MNIGERITALRKEKNISQTELAKRLNVSRQAVSKWETGQTQPEADRIPRICAVFSVSADELLGIIPHAPVQETVTEERKGVDVLLRASLYRRVFTVGSCIAAAGLVVLAIAYGGGVCSWRNHGNVRHRAGGIWSLQGRETFPMRQKAGKRAVKTESYFRGGKCMSRSGSLILWRYGYA